MPRLCLFHDEPLLPAGSSTSTCRFCKGILVSSGARGVISTCVGSSTCLSALSSRQIMEQAIAAICGWRNRFRNDRDLWARIMRRDRVIKELNECMPVIAHTVEMVSRLKLDEGGDKAVVLDLCSGASLCVTVRCELGSIQSSTSRSCAQWNHSPEALRRSSWSPSVVSTPRRIWLHEHAPLGAAPPRESAKDRPVGQDVAPA